MSWMVCALACVAVVISAPASRYNLEIADCDDVAFGPDGDLYLACHSPEDRLRIDVRGKKTVPDEMDGYVLRVNPQTGALIYATRIGGSSYDAALRIRVDDRGFAYTTGITKSAGFPVTPGALQSRLSGGSDAFLVQVAPGGEVVYATLIGGSGNDIGSALEIDKRGGIFVGGSTSSNDFPGQATRKETGEDDAFVCRMRLGERSLVCRVFGGGKAEMLTGIALDQRGGIYASGSTSSADFPAVDPMRERLAGGADLFLTRFRIPSMEMTFSSFFGGSGEDTGWGVAVDRHGNPTVSGTTDSTDLPGTAGAYQPGNHGKKDAFLASFRMGRRRQVRATYFGGANNDESGYDGANMKADRQGNWWLAGMTYSADLPTRLAPQPRFGGGNGDGFVAAFSPDLKKLCFASYFGDKDRNVLEGLAISPFGMVAAVGVSIAEAPSGLHIQIGREKIYAGSNLILFRGQRACSP